MGVCPHLLLRLFSGEARRPVLHDEALAGGHAAAAAALQLLHLTTSAAAAAVPARPLHQLCHLHTEILFRIKTKQN